MMKKTKSMEDYLEAILMIQEEKGICRSVDIANHLNFSKPSVSIAMAKLETSGHVVKSTDGQLYLTSLGEEVASRTLEKHNFLVKLLTHIGVDENTAADDACKLEHSLSPESFTKLRDWFESHK